MSRLRTLGDLSTCLKGDLPPGCDWTRVLDLANRNLVTPQLAEILSPMMEDLPPHVAEFLAEIRRRNDERNRRLWRQLNDAVTALNQAGIQPTLLKGAALWALENPPGPTGRLLSDIDLLIYPAEVEAAIEALSRAGMMMLNRYSGSKVHVVAEFGRPHDVGYLDLHQRAPGPPWIAASPQLASRRRPVRFEGGIVRVPDAAAQILHLVLHDQFHDGAYWSGVFNFRHLLDLGQLTPRLGGGDWAWLRTTCGTNLVRTALDAQLIAARELSGGYHFPTEPRTKAVRAYGRWRLQHAAPRLRLPLALLTALVDWRDISAHSNAGRDGVPRSLGAWALDARRRVEQIRQIMRCDP